MRWTDALYVCLLLVPMAASPAQEFGRPATADEIRLWDIDVAPDGTGLPAGSGTVAQGKEIYQTHCRACHGEKGVGGMFDRLAGGQGSLASAAPVKTVGSFWPYATTLFDYIRRAMPYPAPGSLSTEDTYSVAAYILNLNGILPDDGSLDERTLPQVQMPNRNGFVPDPEFAPATPPLPRDAAVPSRPLK